MDFRATTTEVRKNETSEKSQQKCGENTSGEKCEELTSLSGQVATPEQKKKKIYFLSGKLGVIGL